MGRLTNFGFEDDLKIPHVIFLWQWNIAKGSGQGERHLKKAGFPISWPLANNAKDFLVSKY